MIFVVAGTVGSGKTVYAVSLMLQSLSVGDLVSSNIRLHSDEVTKRMGGEGWKNRYFFLDEDEILNYGAWPVGAARGSGGNLRSLIVIDEAAEWFDAVGADKDDLERLVSWLRHSDKQGCDVCLVVQHWGMLHRRLRMLVAVYFHGRNLSEWKIPGLGFKLPLMRGFTFFSQLDRDARTSLSSPILFYRPEYYRFYDTSAGHGATVGRLRQGVQRRESGVLECLLV